MPVHLGFASGSCSDCPILDVLPVLRAAGAEGVELGTPPKHFDPWQAEQVGAVGRYLADSGLQAISIHAPFGGAFDLAAPNPLHRHATVDAILTAGLALRRVGGRIVVVHPSDLEREGRNVDSHLADAAGSLRVLAQRCEAEDLTLALETPLPHLIGGHPDEFAWLLARTPASLRVCLDTGHTALGRSWHRFLEVAGRRLAHVHASDNRGHWDDHLPPGEGAIDWAEIARSLRAAAFDGWIMLELRYPAGHAGEYFTRAYQQTRALLASLWRDADQTT